LALKKIYILHLGNYLLKPDSGVAQKTFAMVEAMKIEGYEVSMVAISDLPVPAELPTSLRVRTVLKLDYIKEAHRFFESIDPTDLVLFRYPFASPELLRLVERFGRQVIFEHNTIEQAEMLIMQKEHFNRQPLAWSWSYWKYALQTRILSSTVESRLGPAILSNVLGGICVSDEIRRYECGRCAHYKAVTIANGAQVPVHVQALNLPLKGELVVTMLIGSDAVWHGYERLFAGLLVAKDLSVRVVVRMIGMEVPAAFSWPVENKHRIEWLGMKSKQEISELLQSCHIAVGTLALYRKSMTEASPLKVRECLMLGLPMIIGYEDTDVNTDDRFKPFVFSVENNNAPIDWRAVANWYFKLNEQPDHRQIIATLASEVLSMGGKAKKYLQFLEDSRQR